MNWNELGLCPYGYHYGYDYERIKCVNCDVINKIISEICNDENRLVFRALSYIEKESIYNNNIDLYRGNFNEIVLSDDSYQGIINKIFNYVRVTLNNKITEDKQFSYSKCFTVPLFKYSNKEDNPVIVMKNLNLNTFDISYNCVYYQWIKGYYTKDDDHAYFTVGEETIAIKELFSSNLVSPSINEYLKLYYDKKKYLPFERYIGEVINGMRRNEFNQLSLCDLEDINDIRIQSFTLDISMFDRKIMNNYLQYCSNEEVKIKRVASFNIDREIISTESFNSYNGKYYIIQGKNLINNLKLITVCVLFLRKYINEIDKKYSVIIEEYIIKIRNEYIESTDRESVNLLIQHLKDNYKEEFQALKDIKGISRYHNESAFIWFERLTGICCEKNSIRKRLIYILKKEMEAETMKA